jgi:hypothetical protein
MKAWRLTYATLQETQQQKSIHGLVLSWSGTRFIGTNVLEREHCQWVA